MRVLVACEFSGTVRDAFAAKGHDAWSCDILPTEKPGQHYQGDVRDVLYSQQWDLMIAHPPCTYLSNAGIGWFNIERYGDKARERHKKRKAAFEFFMELVNAPIERICVENPVGYPNKQYRKPDQIIHPYYFGDRQLKRTCLWLKGLNPLWYWPCDDLFGKRTMTEYPEPEFVDGSGKARYFTDAVIGYSNNHGHKRSYTFSGIAQAMADQWG